MEYKDVLTGRFLSRPNRFIALVEVNGEIVQCHVKNTGRCRELLVEGATVFLERVDIPGRKTNFDLISVYKGARLINMDSQAPNRIAAEYLRGIFPTAKLRAEVRYGGSRFDFLLEQGGTKTFVEVKGVTLETAGVASFPDAPTVRGLRHVNELCSARAAGFGAMLLFIIQMEGVVIFTPNTEMQPAFTAALRTAEMVGVQMQAMDCVVTKHGIWANSPVKIVL